MQVKVHRVRLVRLELKVLKVTLVVEVQLVLKEMLVQLELKVLQDRVVELVLKVLLVLRVHKDNKVDCLPMQFRQVVLSFGQVQQMLSHLVGYYVMVQIAHLI